MRCTLNRNSTGYQMEVLKPASAKGQKNVHEKSENARHNGNADNEFLLMDSRFYRLH